MSKRKGDAPEKSESNPKRQKGIVSYFIPDRPMPLRASAPNVLIEAVPAKKPKKYVPKPLAPTLRVLYETPGAKELDFYLCRIFQGQHKWRRCLLHAAIDPTVQIPWNRLTARSGYWSPYTLWQKLIDNMYMFEFPNTDTSVAGSDAAPASTSCSSQKASKENAYHAKPLKMLIQAMLRNGLIRVILESSDHPHPEDVAGVLPKFCCEHMHSIRYSFIHYLVAREQFTAALLLLDIYEDNPTDCPLNLDGRNLDGHTLVQQIFGFHSQNPANPRLDLLFGKLLRLVSPTILNAADALGRSPLVWPLANCRRGYCSDPLHFFRQLVHPNVACADGMRLSLIQHVKTWFFYRSEPGADTLRTPQKCITDLYVDQFMVRQGDLPDFVPLFREALHRQEIYRKELRPTLVGALYDFPIAIPPPICNFISTFLLFPKHAKELDAMERASKSNGSRSVNLTHMI